MIRWVAAIFLLLAIFYPLLPFFERLWVGRIPGDVRFRLRGVILCLPFGSAVVWSLAAFLIAKFVRLS